MSEFSKDWKTYLLKWLGRPAINILESHFIKSGIKNPSLQDVLDLTQEEMDRLIISSHSVEGIKALLIFQKQINESNG